MNLGIRGMWSPLTPELGSLPTLAWPCFFCILLLFFSDPGGQDCDIFHSVVYSSSAPHPQEVCVCLCVATRGLTLGGLGRSLVDRRRGFPRLTRSGATVGRGQASSANQLRQAQLGLETESVLAWRWGWLLALGLWLEDLSSVRETF